MASVDVIFRGAFITVWGLRRCRRDRHWRGELGARQVDGDAEPAIGERTRGDEPAHVVGHGSHRRRPDAVPIGLAGVAAGTVVGDLGHQVVGRGQESHLTAGGVSVADHVVERFVDDPVERRVRR